jgi:HAD superfamily hydrolase (TIGR01509 family)
VRYPVLIFDLDDTLIESFPEYVRLHQRVAAEFGWPVPSMADLVHYGATWEATLARLWPDAALDPFIARYEALADEHPYPAIAGVCEALELLHGRGHSLWIVTKRSRRRLAARMEQANLAMDLFTGIFANEDQPASKPDPRCFEPVWRALGQPSPERALYVGDRGDDHLAASAAGLGFVGVRTGPEHHSLGVFDELEHVLDSAAELPRWLEAL